MRSTRDVIDAIFAAAATGDLDQVMSWWATEGVLEDVTLARAFTGRGEIREYLHWYFSALPDVRYEPIRLVVDGQHAVVEWAQPATLAAPFDGLASSVGRFVFLHAVDIFHI